MHLDFTYISVYEFYERIARNESLTPFNLQSAIMEEMQEVNVIDLPWPREASVRPHSFVPRGGFITDHFKRRPAGQMLPSASSVALPVRPVLTAAQLHAAAQKAALPALPRAVHGAKPRLRRTV